MDGDDLLKLGYKYQEKKSMFQNVPPSFKKLVSGKSRYIGAKVDDYHAFIFIKIIS